MITLILSFVVLFIGYFTYGRLVERTFGPDDRVTPANSMTDGVDYMPMKTWRAYLVQLLNIAGTGPIFGALMGACFGPVVFLWIIFGSVLGGAVHDYMVGIVSKLPCRATTTGWPNYTLEAVLNPIFKMQPPDATTHQSSIVSLLPTNATFS